MRKEGRGQEAPADGRPREARPRTEAETRGKQRAVKADEVEPRLEVERSGGQGGKPSPACTACVPFHAHTQPRGGTAHQISSVVSQSRNEGERGLDG